jgi:hypothetical protein
VSDKGVNMHWSDVLVIVVLVFASVAAMMLGPAFVVPLLVTFVRYRKASGRLEH